MTRINDRGPNIVPAGKSHSKNNDSVHQCMHYSQLQDEIDPTRKKFGFVERRQYGPNVPPNIEPVEVFSEIRHCIRRPQPTQIEALNEELSETIYDSYWNKAVGRVRDPTPGLPCGMIPYCPTFGKSSDKSITAGELIHPPKTQGQVIYEDKACHKLYVYSHQDYWPGEQLTRCYDAPFYRNEAHGIKQKIDRSGLCAKRCLTWFNQDPYTYVSRKQATVRRRTVPQLGNNVDKTGATEMVPQHWTFGKPTLQGFFSVADLLNDCTPSLVRRDMQGFISSANKLRNYVRKKINEGLFRLEDFYYELMKLDPEKTCKLHFDCVMRVCNIYKLPVARDRIEPLLVILGVVKPNGEIAYRDFVKFLDINEPFPALRKEHYVFPPEYQEYDKLYAANRPTDKCTCKTHLSKAAGVPSVRTDMALPAHPTCLADMESLGDETTVRACVSPSIYTQYGVSHRDFLKPRTKEFIACIFKRIGVELSEEELESIYREGCQLDKTGGVCVETFRNLLDKRAAESYLKM